ncbi:MAG TPA: HYR domain-containing protein [Candidatus Eisenbacteria bacterium]|nr:HYR domain-containing protein [Candidatus Eisenbacteria bacterium]
MPHPFRRHVLSARAAIFAAASFFLVVTATPSRAADVATDNPDYYPGDVVVITGSGFLPGERVSLRLDQHPTLHDPYVFYSTADSIGSFRNADYTVEDQDLGTSFDLVATGLTSGIVATAFFTDSPKVGSVSIGMQNGSLCAGSHGSATFTVTVNRGSGGGSSGSFTALLSIFGDLHPGITASFFPAIVRFQSGQASATSTLTLSTDGSAAVGPMGFAVRAATSTNDFAIGDGGLYEVGAPAVLQCPADVVVNNAPGQCGAVVNFPPATATGSPIPAITYSADPGSFFPVGVTHVCVSAVNSCASAACEFTVTVVDVEPPSIQVADITQSTDPGTCVATVSALGASAADNCGVVSLIGTRSDGAFLTAPFAKGTTTVTWVATDVSGKTATVLQHVVVNDTQPPTIQAPPALNLTTGPAATACGVRVADAGLISASASDNCGASISSTGIPENNFFPVGTTTITYTATDPSGNTAVGTQTVTVVDDTPPTIAVSNLDLSADAGGCAATIGSLGASANDNCGVDTFVGTRGDGAALTDPFPKGATTITWLATDVHGNTQTATQTVTVADDEAPTVTASDLSLSTDPGSCGATIASLGAAATDNCGVASFIGTRSDGLPLTDPFPRGTTTIAWVATDTSGNKAGAKQHVMVADTEHPTLTAPASLNVTTGPGSQTCGVGVGNAALGTPVASDNCAVTVTVEGIPAGNLFPVGVTTLTWTATDPSGNATMATQTVTVVDDTPPFVTGGESTHATDANSCGAVIGAFGVVQSDNCGVQSVVGTRDDGLALSDPFPVGLTTIHWLATDIHGNTATGTSRIHVEDHEAPSIAAPAAVQASTGSGARICGAVISDAALGQPVATDNCSVVVTRAGVPAGNLFPTGVTVITWTATDPSGNATSATQAVTVVDNTPPTLSVPPSVSFGTGPNATICGLTVTDAMLGAATASDNCSVTLTRTGVPAGNLFPTGVTAVTYTAADPSGNTVTLTQLVTVTDTTPPKVAASNITLPTDAGLCSAAIANLGATATDNCGSPTLSSARSDTKSLTDPFPKGVTTILWTATDAAGNVSTATQTVTVTNATPVAEITAPSSGLVVPVNTPVSLTGTFTDDAGDLHTASWTCDALACPASVNEDSRTASGSMTFATAGVYRIKLVVTDQCGGSSTAVTVGGLDAMVVVYDPSAGFVTGGGWIQSPAGSYVPDPSLAGKANFGFVSKYKKGTTVPTGETEFQFKAGNVDFHSSSYDWLVISGARAQFKGTGTINGAGTFGFLLSAVDGETAGGGGRDKFRIKIVDKVTSQVVYDNMMGAPDTSAAATLLGGGSIAIQTNGGKASASIGASLDAGAASPAASGLAQNRPNPFNPETTLRFTLARSARATLRVFDARGALVRTLVDDMLEAGAHEARWNGLDARGGRVPSGVYYALFSASDGTRDRVRMVLIK